MFLRVTKVYLLKVELTLMLKDTLEFEYLVGVETVQTIIVENVSLPYRDNDNLTIMIL